MSHGKIPGAEAEEAEAGVVREVVAEAEERDKWKRQKNSRCAGHPHAVFIAVMSALHLAPPLLIAGSALWSPHHAGHRTHH